jgi:hypothetical protein
VFKGEKQIVEKLLPSIKDLSVLDKLFFTVAMTQNHSNIVKLIYAQPNFRRKLFKPDDLLYHTLQQRPIEKIQFLRSSFTLDRVEFQDLRAARYLKSR